MENLSYEEEVDIYVYHIFVDGEDESGMTLEGLI